MVWLVGTLMQVLGLPYNIAIKSLIMTLMLVPLMYVYIVPLVHKLLAKNC